MELCDLKFVFFLVFSFISWLSQFVYQSDAFFKNFHGLLGSSNTEITGSDVLESKDENPTVFAVTLFLQSLEAFPHHKWILVLLQTPVKDSNVEISLLQERMLHIHAAVSNLLWNNMSIDFWNDLQNLLALWLHWKQHLCVKQLDLEEELVWQFFWIAMCIVDDNSHLLNPWVSLSNLCDLV